MLQIVIQNWCLGLFHFNNSFLFDRVPESYVVKMKKKMKKKSEIFCLNEFIFVKLETTQYFLEEFLRGIIAQKIKFSIKDVFSKFEQCAENFIFCLVDLISQTIMPNW